MEGRDISVAGDYGVPFPTGQALMRSTEGEGRGRWGGR